MLMQSILASDFSGMGRAIECLLFFLAAGICHLLAGLFAYLGYSRARCYMGWVAISISVSFVYQLANDSMTHKLGDMIVVCGIVCIHSLIGVYFILGRRL